MGVIYMLYHRELVERMQEKYPPGTRGDNGSSLSLLIGKDHFRVVPQQEEAPGMAMQ